jgi:hypothetical protein
MALRDNWWRLEQELLIVQARTCAPPDYGPSSGRIRPIAWDHGDGLHADQPDPDCALCKKEATADDVDD